MRRESIHVTKIAALEEDIAEEKVAKDEADFEYIWSTYFPRWDEAHEWTLKTEHPDCVGHGYCDTDGKIIVVRKEVAATHGKSSIKS
jgi:hypothetical protein